MITLLRILLHSAMLLLSLATFRCHQQPAQQSDLVLDTNAIIIDKAPYRYPINNMPNAFDGELMMIPDEEELLHTDSDPEFPGGVSAMHTFFKKYLHKPKAARRAKVTGKVYVSFMVAKDGRIGDASVLKGIGFGCDEEALRVVLLMPKWKPAQKDGEPISTRFTIPVIYP